MINWTTYISENNPAGVNMVLLKNGYPSAENSEMDEAIAVFIKEKGDDAVVQLLKVHPDFDVIKDIVQNEKPLQKKEAKKVTAQQPEKYGLKIPEISEQTRDLIIIGAIVILLIKVW
jgi:GTPase SAR1 family protein